MPQDPPRTRDANRRIPQSSSADSPEPQSSPSVSPASSPSSASPSSTMNYAAIADSYKSYAQGSPFKQYIEFPTIDALVGDIRGRSVIEIACGEGVQLFRLLAAGASEVVGVDLSSEMIELAERQRQLLDEEARQRSWFGVADAGNRDDFASLPHAPYDVTLAIWLLPYLPNRALLESAIANMGRVTKAGGKVLVTLYRQTVAPTELIDLPICHGWGARYRVREFTGQWRPIHPIETTLYWPGGEVTIDCVAAEEQIVLDSFRNAGFSNARLVEFVIGDDYPGNRAQLVEGLRSQMPVACVVGDRDEISG